MPKLIENGREVDKEIQQEINSLVSEGKPLRSDTLYLINCLQDLALAKMSVDHTLKNLGIT